MFFFLCISHVHTGSTVCIGELGWRCEAEPEFRRDIFPNQIRRLGSKHSRLKVLAINCVEYPEATEKNGPDVIRYPPETGPSGGCGAQHLFILLASSSFPKPPSFLLSLHLALSDCPGFPFFFFLSCF